MCSMFRTFPSSGSIISLQNKYLMDDMTEVLMYFLFELKEVRQCWLLHGAHSNDKCLFFSNARLSKTVWSCFRYVWFISIHLFSISGLVPSLQAIITESPILSISVKYSTVVYFFNKRWIPVHTLVEWVILSTSDMHRLRIYLPSLLLFTYPYWNKFFILTLYSFLTRQENLLLYFIKIIKNTTGFCKRNN